MSSRIKWTRHTDVRTGDVLAIMTARHEGFHRGELVVVVAKMREEMWSPHHLTWFYVLGRTGLNRILASSTVTAHGGALFSELHLVTHRREVER